MLLILEHWTFDSQIYFVIGLFDYFRVTRVWVQHCELNVLSVTRLLSLFFHGLIAIFHLYFRVAR